MFYSPTIVSLDQHLIKMFHQYLLCNSKYIQLLTYMECINSGSNFATRRSSPPYSDDLGCETVLVPHLHPNITHGSKKSHGNCDAHTVVNGVDLPDELCKGSRKNSATRPVKENTSLQLIFFGTNINQLPAWTWELQHRRQQLYQWTEKSSEIRDGVNSTSLLQKEPTSHCYIFALNVVLNHSYKSEEWLPQGGTK